MMDVGVVESISLEEKICSSCKESLSREMFDESDLSKDGLAPKCRSCETRLEEDREAARKKAAKEATAGVVKREYVGVRGGLLLAGYVK